MRKAVGIFATMALIIALIEIWMRSAPVATESATAVGVQPSPGAVSRFELMSRNHEAPASEHAESDFRVLVGDQSAGK
jgi:hypothetical protein